jgi:hypothetical protein
MVSARGNIALVVKGCWNEDAQHFEQLKIALKTIIGFSNFDMLRKRASSLLPSSTFEFTVYHHRNADVAIVRNTYVLEIVANFFGIQSAALEAALSYKTKLVRRSFAPCSLIQMAHSITEKILPKLSTHSSLHG